MKRILKIGILGTAFSVLFTGCGSGGLVTGAGAGYQEIEWQVKETQETSAGFNDGSIPTEAMPDFYEENTEEKFEELDGTPAFKIKDGHSNDSRDFESFDIGGLLSDGTFLYCYVTRVGARPQNDNAADNRAIVHCMAAYNYKTKQFRVLHETSFYRGTADKDEDKETFFMQMCSSNGSGDIFVYDCGIGYLYNSSGDLKFATDVETFVRKHFKGYSIATTEALTDGGNRIYIDLAIEKEEIPIPPEDNGDEGSEEDADKEAEALDEEVDEKTIETVLVYDFKEYTSSIDQANLKMDDQIEQWKNMRNNPAGYLNWTPLAEDDWNEAVKQVPSEWGPSFLYGLENWSEDELEDYDLEGKYISGAPVFQWNGEKKFGYRGDGYVSNFDPDEASYKPFTDLKANTELSNVFVLIDGRYYELYGTTKDDLGDGDYSSVSFSRTVKRVDETYNAEEDKTERTTMEITQYLTKYRKRDTYPNNAYLEGYWTLDDEDIDSVFDVVDGDVFCMEHGGDKENDTVYWMEDDGELSAIAEVSAESMVDIFKDDGNLYLTTALEGWSAISKLNSSTKEVEDTSFVTTETLANTLKKVEYFGTGVDSEYHDAYEDMSSKGGGEKPDENAGEYIDGDNVLHASLGDTQAGLLQLMEDYEKMELQTQFPDTPLESLKDTLEYQRAERISDASGDGYLITSLSHGLVYYDIGSDRAVSLDEGTWYGTWRMGDQFVSVGFSNGESAYGTLDVAHARVKEYKLDDLYKSGLEGIIASAEAALISSKVEHSEDVQELLDKFEKNRAGKDIVFVTPEGDQSALDAWKENTPGEEIDKIEEERKQQKEEESKAREEAGEWDPMDEYRYGDKGTKVEE